MSVRPPTWAAQLDRGALDGHAPFVHLCPLLDGGLTGAAQTRPAHIGRDPLHNRLVLFLATALVAPKVATAQVPFMHNALELDSLAFTKLQARVTSRDSVRVRGVFGTFVIRRPMLASDSLLPATDNSGTPGPRVGLRDVASIQVRGGAAGTGALVGAGVGFAGGLAAGLGLAATFCSDGGCSNEGGGIAVITLGSTAAGALIGALIGAPFKKWHTIYRAR
jgi:hypothetical protein